MLYLYFETSYFRAQFQIKAAKLFTFHIKVKKRHLQVSISCLQFYKQTITDIGPIQVQVEELVSLYKTREQQKLT